MGADTMKVVIDKEWSTCMTPVVVGFDVVVEESVWSDLCQIRKFIHIGRLVVRSVTPPKSPRGVAASYGESVGAKAWSESVALLAALMARGGSSVSMASGRFHLGC
ncbi:hypothetical protein GW17_00044309 [Ensete ventricosum]|nr:hypothetical protein GW17_00044309 [Ensete ventricosum]